MIEGAVGSVELPPESFDVVHSRYVLIHNARAIGETFSARGMDYAFGSTLPRLVAERGASLLSMEYDCPVVSGGADLAAMMRLSTLSLQDKYVATGLATPADIAGYGEFAATSSCWGNYYATVRVLARKAAAEAGGDAA